MFGKVADNQLDQTVELEEVRYLSMGTNHKSVNHGDKVLVPKKRNSTPVRSFTTPWLSCDAGRFYVHLAIVGPIPEQAQYDFSLPCTKSQDLFQAASDLLKAFEEEPWGKAPLD